MNQDISPLRTQYLHDPVENIPQSENISITGQIPDGDYRYGLKKFHFTRGQSKVDPWVHFSGS